MLCYVMLVKLTLLPAVPLLTFASPSPKKVLTCPLEYIVFLCIQWYFTTGFTLVNNMYVYPYDV